MQLSRAQPVELLEAHDERTPSVRVYTILLPRHKDRVAEVNVLHSDFDVVYSPAQCLIVHPKVLNCLDDCLELDRALANARGFNRSRRLGGESTHTKLVAHMLIAARHLPS